MREQAGDRGSSKTYACTRAASVPTRCLRSICSSTTRSGRECWLERPTGGHTKPPDEWPTSDSTLLKRTGRRPPIADTRQSGGEETFTPTRSAAERHAHCATIGSHVSTGAAEQQPKEHRDGPCGRRIDQAEPRRQPHAPSRWRWRHWYGAAQPNVLISGRFADAYEQLLPEFQRMSGGRAARRTGPVAAGDTVCWIIGDTESGTCATREGPHPGQADAP